MKQKLLYIFCMFWSLIAFQNMHAQTMQAGDIAFVGYHTDSGDGFTFIALTDIPSGEIIFFTDKGWNATSATWYANSEDHIIWTAPSGGTPLGSVVSIIETSGDNFSVSQGTAVLSRTDSGFSMLGGDSILAYQSSSGAEPANPTFIAGIYGDDNYLHTVGCNDASGWFDCSTCTHISGSCSISSGDTSGLPAGLTNGENALALFPSSGEEDNAKYTGILTGTVSVVRAAINNPANWTTSDSSINIASTQYSDISITPDGPVCTMTASISSQTNVDCNGNSSGALTVTPADGTAPYTYLWDDGSAQTTAIATGLAAGTYEVTVTDDNGCIATASTTITEPAVLSVATVVDSNASCISSNGAATAGPSGGTGPYTYLWDNAATTASITGLAVGTYNVVITDANGCTASNSATITNGSTLEITSASQTNITTCYSDATGVAEVNAATGGTAPYTYDWTGDPIGDGTTSISGLTAGTYTCTVTDALGCTDTETFIITAPAPLLAINSTTFVYEEEFVQGQYYCPGSDNYDNWNAFRASIDTNIGYSSVKISGTQLPEGLTLNDPAAANQIAQALAAGTATSVTVGGATWSVGIGCTTSCTLPGDAVELNVDNGGGCSCGSNPTIRPCIGNANWGSFGSDGACGAVTQTMRVELIGQKVTVTNVSCNGNNDGSIALDVEGGIAPYTYVWSPGNPTGQGTNTISELAIGTYSVTVTDANGCTNTGSATITEPEVLEASTVVNANETCEIGNNGIATASATGGTAPYTYLWSNAETTATITGLTAGTYNVTITDANGCTDTESVTIEETSSIIVASVVDANVTCNGGTDGAASVSVSSGGVAPFTYLWDNAATTASITGVTAGTYNVTITDDNGCTATSSVTITEPIALVAESVVDSNVSCNSGSNGSATASATGGTAPYTYLWSNGATTASIVGVVAGTYDVTITAANGCTDTSSVTITEPASLAAASVVDSNTSCNGSSDGSATASATGGTAPYTYLWSNSATTASIVGVAAGTYNVTITDANGCTDTSSVTITEPASLAAASVVDSNTSCNGGSDGSATANATGGTAPYTYLWSNTATTASIVGVAAGTYDVTITDANGCTDTSSVTITEPASLAAASVVDSNTSCNGGSDGSATANATGGTAPYTYLWSNTATTASIVGVAAGTYDVTITDANGCTDTSSVTITEPTALVASSLVDSNASCNGGSDGSATASATGGTAPYTYLWSNAATTASIVGVAAGTYNITITDANGCTDTSSVTITEPASLAAASVVDSNASCNGGSDGSATANATGGTAPYTYLWSNTATTASIVGVAAGTYDVTITDANGCTDTSSVTITEPTALVASSLVDSNASCNGGSDGSATASATGGTAPYTYLWSNAATTASIVGVAAGTYNITITDANGCTDTSSVTITEPASLAAASVVDSNASCNGGSDGSATASATGGTAPYTYLWSNSATTASIVGVAAGTYNVTITDANGCTDTSSVTITEPTTLVASSLVDSNASCNGGSDGSATASATGGTAPYTYLWSNAATTASIVGVAAGTYNVTITDANGCTDTSSVTITEPASLAAASVVDSNASCNGGSDGSATANATGGTTPYTYLWSNAATTASIVGVAAGTYNVTITDANGCTDTSSVTITEPTALVASSVVDSNASCNGGSDGSATASATGGTAPYTYLWSNAATTASIVGVAAGTYNVTITDANGCTDTSGVTITEPTALDNSITQDSGVLTANQAGATYQWYACPNTLLVGETDQSFTPSVVGSYKVEITMESCVEESACEEVTVLGLEDVENNFKFSMYPNPSDRNVHITTSMDGYFQIINQLGQIIKTFKVDANIESTVYVGDLNNGFYFVKSVNNNFIQKLIVKK